MPALVLIALVLLSGVAASGAEASFPGRKGDLLVLSQTPTGGHLTISELFRIAPGSGETTRMLICNGGWLSDQAPPRCFTAGAPAASPDGGSVAFTVADRVKDPPFTDPFTYSVRVVSLATGASTRVPLPGRTQVQLVRFSPDLSFVMEAPGPQVLLAGPDGSDRGPLLSNAAQPDVSSTGSIAFVRKRNVYVRRPGGKAHRLTRRGGSQPSWSPHGQSLAFTRRGFVYVVSADGGRTRRLARGVDPVWSPDGRQIAFFRTLRARGYYGLPVTFLYTLDRRTGRVRRASSQALSDDLPPTGVDWQPIR